MTKQAREDLLRVDHAYAARVQLETCVLAGVLAWAGERPYLAADVLAVAPPNRFAGLDTKAIATAMQACLLAGGTADLPNVGIELGRMCEVRTGSTRGGIEPLTKGRLLEIATMRPYLGEAELMRDARRIADEARKDAAQQGIATAVSLLRTPGLPSGDVATVLRGVVEELESMDGDTPDAWQIACDSLLETVTRGEVLSPLPTPWRNLNRVLHGGIAPGELCILAARPSVGKTAVALNWAYSTACSGKTAVVASLEMRGVHLGQRMVSAISGVPHHAFRNGFSAADRARVLEATHVMRNRPIRLVDAVRTTPAEVRRIARAEARRGKLGLVVVDYLQIMTPDERSTSREREVAEMSRSMKALALEIEAPVLVLSQLSREIEKGGKREPKLSDLRESGAIEQDADIVAFLHPVGQQADGMETLKVLVRKGRNSGTGDAWLLFDKACQAILDDANERVWRDMENHQSQRGTPEF